MSTRRILLLEDPHQWGGVYTMTRTLVQALSAQGWQVTPLSWQQTPWAQLVDAAKRHDVIVASHNFGPTYCGAALKAITGKPLVSWVHGPLLDVLHEVGTSLLKKMWLKLLYQQVSQFVCVSRTTQDSLLGFITLGKQQCCTVVPNGIAPMPEGQTIHVHAGHGGEGTPPLLLGYVGRLSAEKRPHLLLDTLRFLPAEAQLGIVGDGPIHRKMVHDGLDLMHQGRVHFLGKHPSGASLYKPWQMTLLTSRYEGCPLTALESLACGVPCVSLPIPAMRELYDLDAPYLLARGDAPVALAEAVMTVLNLPEQQVRDDMARIVARHSVEGFVREWQEVLHTC
ncbi:glycosyltransferase [Limnohabitans sp.]|uniref:glycosyltransferase n=1 Tax=Limnohabitans sp. TaxID=1907725 RepID=UPI00286F3E98|nr:glycosyltransferase [Limnohabitans sp.]